MSFSARIQAGVSISGGDVLFSKERIESTLVSGYFEILGEMTKSSAGLAFVLSLVHLLQLLETYLKGLCSLLDQFKMFTCFYRISELRSREDLVKLIIEKVDYSRDGHPRVFLHKALTSSYKVRLASLGGRSDR